MYSLLDGYEGQLEVEVHVSKEYQGACKVILEGSWGKAYFAVLPCLYEAKRVMGLALNPHVGGFHGVIIVETNDNITHDRAEDWLFEH